MKKILFSLLLTSLVATTAMAQENDNHDKDKEKHKEKVEPKFKKTKSYSKSYPLGSNDKVSLENQFGEMKIITWDKAEVKVDATITGKSDDEARAQQILDYISIADSKSGNTASFKTNFDKDKKTWNNNSKDKHYNEGMEINYLVYLPATAALKAENHFGKMIVPDYRGEAELESKFGSLTAGKISNAKEVTVEFGKADITHINGGKLTIKFSQGLVNKLTGDVRSNIEFSNAKLVLDNDAKNLDLRNSYSTVYLDVDKNFSASFDIHTSHGSFSNKTDFPIKEQGGDKDRYGPKFNYQYNGSSGSGNNKVKAHSSFGEIVVGHNIQVDLSEKKKSKPTRVI